MPEPRRIHENEPASCAGCRRVTNTIRGCCPECGYMKDDTWLPAPRRDRLPSLWPEDWTARLLIAGALAVVGALVQQVLS